jgi:hypothetical protein
VDLRLRFLCIDVHNPVDAIHRSDGIKTIVVGEKEREGGINSGSAPNRIWGSTFDQLGNWVTLFYLLLEENSAEMSAHSHR